MFTFVLAKQEDVVKEPKGTYSDLFLSEKRQINWKEYIKEESLKRGLDFDLVNKIVFCESGYNEKAIGDHGGSYGLFQIHLPAHSEITKEQALNGYWATEWSLNKMKQGYWNLWTCYKRLL